MSQPKYQLQTKLTQYFQLEPRIKTVKTKLPNKSNAKPKVQATLTQMYNQRTPKPKLMARKFYQPREVNFCPFPHGYTQIILDIGGQDLFSDNE